jgi:hypothetical protein
MEEILPANVLRYRLYSLVLPSIQYDGVSAPVLRHYAGLQTASLDFGKQQPWS